MNHNEWFQATFWGLWKVVALPAKTILCAHCAPVTFCVRFVVPMICSGFYGLHHHQRPIWKTPMKRKNFCVDCERQVISCGHFAPRLVPSSELLVISWGPWGKMSGFALQTLKVVHFCIFCFQVRPRIHADGPVWWTFPEKPSRCSRQCPRNRWCLKQEVFWLIYERKSLIFFFLKKCTTESKSKLHWWCQT